MPYLSGISRERLLTCDDRLIRIAREVIRVYDFTVVDGHRTPAEQAALYARGRTVPGDVVTWTMTSPHNHEPSLAFDFCPWTPGVGLDWSNTRQFFKIAGAFLYVAGLYEYPVTWAGDATGDYSADIGHLQIQPLN